MELEYVFKKEDSEVKYTYEITNEEAFEILKDSGYLTRKEVRKYPDLSEFTFSKALVIILKDLCKSDALEEFSNEIKSWSVEEASKPKV